MHQRKKLKFRLILVLQEILFCFNYVTSLHKITRSIIINNHILPFVFLSLFSYFYTTNLQNPWMYFLSIIHGINEIRVELLRNPESRRETPKEVNFRIDERRLIHRHADRGRIFQTRNFHHWIEKNEGSSQRVKTSRSRATWKARKMDFVWIRYTHFMAEILTE